MRRTIGILAVAVVALAACNRSQSTASRDAGATADSVASNPLIGTWTSDDPENGCAQRVVFDANTSAAHYGSIGPKPAYDSNQAVSYVVDGANKVTAVGEGTGAGGEIWVFADTNHAMTGSADQCRYTRSG